MTWTYAQIRAAVAEALGDPAGGQTLLLADGAIKLAINEINMQPWWFNFEPDEQITLVTGQREYTLLNTPQLIDSIWYLDEDADQVQSPVLLLPQATFVKSGFHTSAETTGRPDVATFNEETGKLEFNRTPTAVENGRIMSVAYYFQIPNPPVTVGDQAGGLIVECSTWRIRRQVPGYDWVTDKKNADIEKLRVRAMRRVAGKFASGHR